MLKVAAEENFADPNRIGAHTLRSGGADAVFVSGYEAEIVKIRGRWKSGNWAFYRRNGDSVLVTVGKGMSKHMVVPPKLPRQSQLDEVKRNKNNGRECGGGSERYTYPEIPMTFHLL